MTRKNTTEKPTMTKKEALAVMHKLQEAAIYRLCRENASEEDRTLRSQMHTALRIFDHMVWHEQIGYRQLCCFCYLRIVEDGDLLITRKSTYQSGYCCNACLARLKAEEEEGMLIVEKFGCYDGDWKFVLVETQSDEQSVQV